jgi:hypothetical protein
VPHGTSTELSWPCTDRHGTARPGPRCGAVLVRWRTHRESDRARLILVSILDHATGRVCPRIDR